MKRGPMERIASFQNISREASAASAHSVAGGHACRAYHRTPGPGRFDQQDDPSTGEIKEIVIMKPDIPKLNTLLQYESI